MSTGALRAAWEAAQQPASDTAGGALRAAWEAAQKGPPLGHDFHAEYASGKLGNRMASENVHEDAPEAPDQSRAGQRFLGAAASFGKQIPGVEIAQAGLRAGARTAANKLGLPVAPEGYGEALSNIRQGEESAGGVGRFNSFLGGALAAGAMPGSPTLAGARYGILNALGNADPNVDAKSRLRSSMVQGGIGAVTGRLAENLTNAARAKIAKPIDANLVDQAVERGTVAGPMYDKFRNLGDLGRTPQLDALLGTPAFALTGGAPATEGLPIIRRAIDAVKGESPSLSKLPDTDARVLDAAYKRVGSKAFSALHGFEPGEARSAFLDAIDQAAQTKGGSCAEPVGEFASRSQDMGAVTRGAKALKYATGSAAGEKSALNDSPPALKQWLKANPDETGQATQGVLGQMQRQPLLRFGRVLGTPSIPYASPVLNKGSNILQSIGANGPAKVAAGASLSAETPLIQRALQALGIVGATAPVQP